VNKIEEAFSTIKLDESLKDRTYLFLKNRQPKKVHLFRPIIVLNVALALTLILVFNYDKPENKSFNVEGDMNVNVLSEAALGFNSFTYKESNYFSSDIIIKPSDLDSSLGVFDQLVVRDSRLESSQDYQLFTVKNNEKMLVIKIGENLYSFEKK
jgi:hypothetical protein